MDTHTENLHEGCAVVLCYTNISGQILKGQLPAPRLEILHLRFCSDMTDVDSKSTG